jgi:type IV fimbrial biogenesis protein FimT
MHIQAQGFTLIELLTTTALLMLLLGIGVPMFTGLARAQRLDDRATELLLAVTLARSESVKRNHPILVRARDGDWGHGWEVFADLDNNTLRAPNEPLIAVTAGSNDIIVRGNTPVAHYIRFTPSGRPKKVGGAFQAGTIFLCYQSAEVGGQKLIMSATGRIRVEKYAPHGECVGNN